MGRPAHPWFRASRNRWHVKIGGKMVDLGPDKAAAFALFEQLIGKVSKSAGEPIAQLGATGAMRPGTVSELVPTYVKQLDVKPKTRVDYADRLAWLSGRFGVVTVSALDPQQVEDELRLTGWKANTRRQTANVVEAFVRWAGRKDFKLRKPPVESRGGESVLTADEMAKLVAAASGDFAAFLQTLWLCGCRPSEARNMTCENVNWGAGVAVLKEHKSAKKTGKPRLIPLSADAVAVLEVQRAKHQTGHLFRSAVNNGPLRAWEVDRLMRRTRKRAGVRKDVTAYFTRHSFATRKLESGMADSDVAAILGHSGTGMLHKHYSHVAANTRRLRDLLDRTG